MNGSGSVERSRVAIFIASVLKVERYLVQFLQKCGQSDVTWLGPYSRSPSAFVATSSRESDKATALSARIAARAAT
jgi:hypothetical protein